MRKQLVFVVLVVLFAQSASAQQIYKWRDEKGQWHYADFLPIGFMADHSTQARSDVDPLGSAPRYLLVFPPLDPSKPLSEWIPVQSFDSAAECKRARAL